VLIADTHIQQADRPVSADLGLVHSQFMYLSDEQQVVRAQRSPIGQLHAANQQAGMLGCMKVTIDLDADVYRAIKVEAARTDRSVREIVDEALEAWLDAVEATEDAASATAALEEYRRDGGEAAEAFFGSLAAETKATYGSDES
jgi:plasmid stability protein